MALDPLMRLPQDVPPEAGADRLADLCVHLLGIAAGLAACLVLARIALGHGTPRPAWALAAYGAGLCAMLLASALYNMAAPGRLRQWLRRCDHAAIYLMIAGTYAPVCLLGLPRPWGGALLAVVGVLALLGAAQALLGWGRGATSVAGYLALGWVGIAALPALLMALRAEELLLLAAGGLVYSLGTAVLLRPGLRFQNAAWHGCVLAAAACHFCLVLSLALRWPAA